VHIWDEWPFQNWLENSKPYDILLNEIHKIEKYLKNSQPNKELKDLFSKK
jgi:hypothetical protein